MMPSDCFLHSGPYSRSCCSVVNYTPTSSACSYVTVRSISYHLELFIKKLCIF